MATTVHEPPKVPAEIEKPHDRSSQVTSRPVTTSGNGGGRSGLSTGDLRRVKNYAPPPSSTGMWVVLGFVAMTFAAFTSALIVRRGGASDWRHLTLPGILYLNTVVLIASSITLEMARRRVGAFMRGLRTASERPALWLYITLALGLLFVAGQYVAWLELRSRGLYLATNPNSSFFYVLTAVHVIHVSGGLGGLSRVIHKLNHSTLRKSTLDATARYWHFMDGLWIYLLILLWMKL
jgi:cytochrome c oxidase subunit III